jgi:DNA replication protein DnaC
MREYTAQQADDLYELISERAQASHSLITTSNRNPPDWCPLFSNPVVAESLLDRLINTSHQVLHERPQLPAEQAPRTRHPPVHDEHQVTSHAGQTGGIA